MRIVRLSLLLVAVAVISAAPSAGGEVPTGAADCAKDRFLEELALAATPTEPAAEPLFLAAPGKGRKSTMTSSSTSSATACEWYDIRCSNGTTEECCGSVNSCLSYCEEVCGGPCVYQET